MKILHLTQRFPPAPGGVEEHVLQISKRLAKKGHEVIIFTSDLERDKPFIRLSHGKGLYLENEQINVRRFKAVKLLNLKHGLGVIIPGMREAALREKVDVVHAHAFGFWPTYVGMAKKILDQTPLIITPHSSAGSRDYGVLDVRKLPLKIADKIIALTESEQKHLVSLGIDSNKISVIPNGLDLKKFRGLPDGYKKNHVILYVGRIDIRTKGLDTLIKAVPSVLEVVQDAKFVFVGPDWGDMAFLKELAHTLNVETHVIFVGSTFDQEEKLRYYMTADVCVLPSNIESFAIVILESMACGTPVVATRVGGVPDIINDKENGILVPPKDPKKLADAISYLLTDKAMAVKMGQKGRRIVQRYSWESVTDQTEEVYWEVCR